MNPFRTLRLRVASSWRSLRPSVPFLLRSIPLGIVLGLMLAGCGESGEPLLPVAGQVTENGVPLITGSVTLHPDASKGNESLHNPTGPIDQEGRYQVFTSY